MISVRFTLRDCLRREAVVAGYALGVLLRRLQVLAGDVEGEQGHSGRECSCAGGFGGWLSGSGGFAVDVAEVFPSGVVG